MFSNMPVVFAVSVRGSLVTRADRVRAVRGWPERRGRRDRRNFG
ncbi:MAG: hypothetical protein AAGI45_09005 [Cyanobacteria bacterium P01_H01_bin.26]